MPEKYSTAGINYFYQKFNYEKVCVDYHYIFNYGVNRIRSNGKAGRAGWIRQEQGFHRHQFKPGFIQSLF